MGFSLDGCSQRQFGGGALNGFRERNETVSSSVRTRMIRSRVAQDWPAEAIVRDGSDGRQLSENDGHDRSIPSGRSRARPDAAEPSIVVADRGSAIRLRGAPPSADASTGAGLD